MTSNHIYNILNGAIMARETGNEYMVDGMKAEAQECFDRVDWYENHAAALDVDDGPEIANDISLIEIIIQRSKSNPDLADYAPDIAILIEQLKALHTQAIKRKKHE